MAGMDITPERENRCCLPRHGRQLRALFVGQRGKYTSVDRHERQEVGVQNGTTQKFIMDKHPEICTVTVLDSYQNAAGSPQNGRIDAVFGDTAVVTRMAGNPKRWRRSAIKSPIRLFRHHFGGYRGTSGQHRAAAEIQYCAGKK